ncbi:hypothetical protein [Virgibacillus ainsalahensis]
MVIKKNGRKPGNKKANRTSNLESFTTADLLSGQSIELVVAALLVTGKLRSSFVTIYRDEPTVEVLLTGEFMRPSPENANKMAEFINENGDMTIEEIMEGIKQQLNN